MNIQKFWSNVNKNKNNPELWEILVPVADNTGNKYLITHHWEWDNKVIAIAGGLSVLSPVKGAWESNREGMIPVRICTDRYKMRTIMKMTLRHYNQEAIFAYVVSEKVIFLKRGVASDQNNFYPN